LTIRPIKDGPLTDKRYVMKDPAVEPPPLGQVLLVINPGGVLIKSHWHEGCLAWMFHPVIPQSVKERQAALTKSLINSSQFEGSEQ
jgi:hypothetical protein